MSAEFVYDTVYYISEKMIKCSIKGYNFDASIQQTDVMPGSKVKRHYPKNPSVLLWKCDEVAFPNGCIKCFEWRKIRGKTELSSSLFRSILIP